MAGVAAAQLAAAPNRPMERSTSRDVNLALISNSSLVSNVARIEPQNRDMAPGLEFDTQPGRSGIRPRGSERIPVPGSSGYTSHNFETVLLPLLVTQTFAPSMVTADGEVPTVIVFSNAPLLPDNSVTLPARDFGSVSFAHRAATETGCPAGGWPRRWFAVAARGAARLPAVSRRGRGGRAGWAKVWWCSSTRR